MRLNTVRRQALRMIGRWALGMAGPVVYPARANERAPGLAIVVPYPAGSLSDAIARDWAEPVRSRLGGPVLVENIGGASGTLGARKVLEAAPDGRTLLLASPNEVILAPLVQRAVGLTAAHFRMVCPIASTDIVLVVRPGLRAATAAELLTMARTAQASRPLSYGSVGIGSLYHLLGDRLGKVGAVEMTHVPYKGGGALLQDIGRGEVDFALLPYSTILDGLARERRLSLVGAWTVGRSSLLPDLPALGESVAQLSERWTIWTGFMVSGRTGDSIVEQLHTVLSQLLAEPGLRAVLRARAIEPFERMSTGSAQQFYMREVRRLEQLVADAGVQPT
jgi:tripartite-type tricarboxylate transporter receptor subunit TctC